MINHRDTIRHGQGFPLIVGDINRGYTQLLMQVFELDLHLLAQFLIQRGQRFVHQQDSRAKHERAGKRHALALAPGQAGLFFVRRDRTTGPLPVRLRPARRILLPDTTKLQRESDIFRDRHMRKQRIALKHHADVASMRRCQDHLRFTETNTARVGPVEAGYGHQKCRFSRSRWSQQGQELPALDLQVHRIERVKLAVSFGKSLNMNRQCRRCFRRLVAPDSWPK